MAPVLAVATIALAATTACSQTASQSAASKAPAGARSAAATATPKIDACNGQIITKAEAAEVLGAPISEIAPTVGDAQSCEFKATESLRLTVSVRPGFGDATVKAWRDGKMSVPATPLAHVGDQAVWVGDLHKVYATKNNLLCGISATGISGSVADAPQKIGAMCEKVFAAAGSSAVH
jgi:hypothetical protein